MADVYVAAMHLALGVGLGLASGAWYFERRLRGFDQ